MQELLTSQEIPYIQVSETSQFLCSRKQLKVNLVMINTTKKLPFISLWVIQSGRVYKTRTYHTYIINTVASTDQWKQVLDYRIFSSPKNRAVVHKHHQRYRKRRYDDHYGTKLEAQISAEYKHSYTCCSKTCLTWRTQILAPKMTSAQVIGLLRNKIQTFEDLGLDNYCSEGLLRGISVTVVEFL